MFEQKQKKHFYHRAGFGLPVDSQRDSLEESLANQCKVKPLTTIAATGLEKITSEEMLRQKRKLNRIGLLDLNAAWFNQLNDPEAVIREKMTLFWHDHFACRTGDPFRAQTQINTIRMHALGNFADLLKAVSKDAAMLSFLTVQKNTKESPNENFARELMELFTLGRGQYTEADIKNAARAFTGWSFDRATGEFQVLDKHHDFGAKTFRGKSGNFSGDDILNLILEDRQTATFITKKLTTFFVGNLRADLVTSLSDNFYRSGYNIEKLLRDILGSDWFYDLEYVGNRVKSPIELIAGIQTNTNGVFNSKRNIMYLQKALSQVLFRPPNVSGWPNGNEWIDSSSLTFRMALPALLINNLQTEFSAKDDGDVNNETNAVNRQDKLSYSVNLDQLSKIFHKRSETETLEAIEDHLIATPPSPRRRDLILQLAKKAADDKEFVKKAFIGFMSLPEYQLC